MRPTNQQRIALLENFFSERLIYNKDFERIDHAVELIGKYKGQLRTRQLAQEVCLGIKQFERLFAKHVGINPKKFSGIIRFQNVIQMKNKHKNLNLYQLASNNGYHDQSHFIHDFKNITGFSPREFFNTSE